MVNEVVNVLEESVEITGGHFIGEREGYVSYHTQHVEAGYVLGVVYFRSGTAQVELRGPDDGAVKVVGFDTHDDARAEYERIRAQLGQKAWVEWATTTLTEAGIIPDDFRAAILAGEKEAFLVAADWQDEHDNPTAAILLRSTYYRLTGPANVVIREGRGKAIVFNPQSITKRCPVRSGVGEVRAAIVEKGKRVVILSVKIDYHQEQVQGRWTTRSYARVDEKIFNLGDMAEYDSFNLVYYAAIESITEKTVVIGERHGRGKSRLTLARFIEKNWDFDLAKAQKRNSEWSD